LLFLKLKGVNTFGNEGKKVTRGAIVLRGAKIMHYVKSLVWKELLKSAHLQMKIFDVISCNALFNTNVKTS